MSNSAEYVKRFRERHPERGKELQRKYRETHKEQYRE